MKIYLISNNLLIDNIVYNNENLDEIRKMRPLNTEGEKIAKTISELEILADVEKIYSSMFSSSLCTAKYLANKYMLPINISKDLNDCKVGALQNKTMNFLKNNQEHDFDYKMYGGESLNEVGSRMNYFINNLIDKDANSVIFTHKRSIMAFFLKFAKIGYNLDDELILEFNDKVIHSNSDKEYEIYELIIEENKIIDINVIN